MPAWLDKLLKRKHPPELKDADLEAFFTDVEHLRDVFHKLVTAPSLPKRLLVIHGVGGVGKSILLRMYRLYCKRQDIPVALVSGDEAKDAVGVLCDLAADLAQDDIKLPAVERTLERYRAIQAKVKREGVKIAGAAVKAGARAAVEMAASTIPVVGPVVGAFGGAGAEAFVDWLRGFLPRSDVDLYLDPAAELTQDFVSDLAPAAERRRLVLMLDTYEQMTGLDDWVRDLVQRLPSNVLTVIAGREALGAVWDRDWPGWMAHARIEALEAMDEDDMRTLVRRYYATIRGDEPDPTQVEEIVRFARGLPMAVTSVVGLWVHYGMQDFRVVKPEVVADLVDRLMEGTPPEMRPVLEASATLRWFNKEILRELLPAEQVEQIYDELRRFPFVRSRVEGLALHDVVREMLDENLKTHDPERHRMLHEHAAGYLEAQLAQATGDEQERWTLERLYHRIRADEEAGIRLFQEIAEELVRHRLANRLRVLLNDVNTYRPERENSCLWWEYYNAWLIRLEGRLIDAEKVYQTVSKNDRAEPKLRAYALCDLGTILRDRRIGKEDVMKTCARLLEQSLELFKELFPPDHKLVSNLLELGRICRDRGDWEGALAYLNRARSFCLEHANPYDVVFVYLRFQHLYAYKGDWKRMFEMNKQAMDIAHELGDVPFLRIECLSVMKIAWIWAGRYAEAERDIRESMDLKWKPDSPISFFSLKDLGALRDLGFAMGFAGKQKESSRYLSESLEKSGQQLDFSPREQAVTLGFYGVFARSEDREKRKEAKEKLEQSLEIKQEIRDTSYLLETLNGLGILSEVDQEWISAEKFFSQTLSYRWTGRLYFECGALTGLVRVKYAQGDHAAIPPLLAEAEHLAQQYEYNDHLASLRLTQGHTAWEGHVPEWSSGFDAALCFYQHTLIYALRYNRFLLDEVLWGGGVATPLRPIIPHCLERGDEGHQMLVALRDWWQTGVNDIGTPRPDTISPIPEGIPLLEAERIAREREPGDGSPRQTVIEKIEAALATAPDS